MWVETRLLKAAALAAGKDTLSAVLVWWAASPDPDDRSRQPVVAVATDSYGMVMLAHNLGEAEAVELVKQDEPTRIPVSALAAVPKAEPWVMVDKGTLTTPTVTTQFELIDNWPNGLGELLSIDDDAPLEHFAFRPAIAQQMLAITKALGGGASDAWRLRQASALKPMRFSATVATPKAQMPETVAVWVQMPVRMP